jgi:hypothetical protein
VHQLDKAHHLTAQTRAGGLLLDGSPRQNDIVRPKVVAIRLFLHVELSFKFKMSGIRCRNGAWCGWS